MDFCNHQQMGVRERVKAIEAEISGAVISRNLLSPLMAKTRELNFRICELERELSSLKCIKNINVNSLTSVRTIQCNEIVCKFGSTFCEKHI